MRFAITPGIKIPLSTYDAAEERQNIIDSKDFKTARTDRGAWGLGARFAYDYLVTPDFYINVYNQTSVFLETNQDYGVDTSTLTAISDVDVKYGTEAIFEVEPNYTISSGNGIRTSFALPLTYTMTGETEIDGNGGNDESWDLAVSPFVSVFFTQWALPMEFQLGYSTALSGESAKAGNTVSLQVKNYLRF
jgi:hypothetical protein